MKKTFDKIRVFLGYIPNIATGFLANSYKELKVIKVKLENFKETNYELGIYHIDRSNMSDAKFRFFLVTKLDPHNVDAHYHLARCHLFNLDFEKAKKEFEIVLSLNKNHKEAKFRLNQLNEKIGQDMIPIKVIEEDYDNLAKTYETILENRYLVNVQEILAKEMSRHIEGIDDLYMIDIGCGTGLVGYFVKRLVAIKSLLGIDISSRMLEYAKNLTNDEQIVYNLSKKMDYNNLGKLDDKFDIITACLSLEYSCDLSKFFKNIDNIRAKKTFLGLVVLKTSESGVIFDYKNGCYSFGLEYMEDIFKQYKWKILEQKDVKILEDGTHALIFVLKK